MAHSNAVPGSFAESPYELVTLADSSDHRLLGEGRYGSVFLGRHAGTAATVAVKIAPTLLAEEYRLMVAAAAVAPGVLAPVGLYTDLLSSYLVLPYCLTDWKQLTVKARSDKIAIPLSHTNHVFKRVVRAVVSLHDAGIAHRDLKPENVLIDGAGEVKVTDFGYAVEVGQTEVDPACGTDSYKAPEIWAGGKVDYFAADVFALGLVYLATAIMARPWESSEGGDFRAFAKVYRGERLAEKAAGVVTRNAFAKEAVFREGAGGAAWSVLLRVKDVDAREAVVRMLDPDVATRWGARDVSRSRWLRGVEAVELGEWVRKVTRRRE